MMLSRISMAGVTLLIGFASNLPSTAAQDALQPTQDALPEPKKLTAKFTVLWDGRLAPLQADVLPEKFPVTPLDVFRFTGPRPKDPFLLGDFQTAGRWGVKERSLTPITGSNTAIHLAHAEDFELEGVLNVEGLGGWFLLFGWDEGHGFALYNVTLKESGSPWQFCEFRDSVGIESTHRELHRYAWKGNQPFKLTAAEGKLNVTAGNETIARDLAIENYQRGHIILGTYDTKYGAKPLRVYSLRIRAK